MQKLIALGLASCAVLILTACGAQKDSLDRGQALVQSGDCAGAATYLEDAVAQPANIMELAYAYFLKGRCAESAGDTAGAYENLYAAKVVACYAVNHDIQVNWNTYGRSEFCQRIIPDMLAKLAPDAGDVAAIEAKVDSALNERYLKRFEKRLQ